MWIHGWVSFCRLCNGRIGCWISMQVQSALSRHAGHQAAASTLAPAGKQGLQPASGMIALSASLVWLLFGTALVSDLIARSVPLVWLLFAIALGPAAAGVCPYYVRVVELSAIQQELPSACQEEVRTLPQQVVSMY